MIKTCRFTYAIGDIQGCFNTLQNLLHLCDFDPTQDRLWLVGDLVNRGPRSLETLRFIKSLGSAAITVLGNHDLYLLMIAAGQSHYHNDDTLAEIFSAPDRDELLNWLRQQPLLYRENDYVLIHAGLLPGWTVYQAEELAKEVESLLNQDENIRHQLLANLWGEQPSKWNNNLKGWPRYRLIVNAMTRLRFCSVNGEIELKSKGPPTQAPKGYMPWFDIPHRKSSSHTLIFGHWSALGLHLTENLIGLDTGCLWGGTMSALRLEDRRLFQVEPATDETLPLPKALPVPLT